MTKPDLVLDSDVLIEIPRGRPEASQWKAVLGPELSRSGVASA